MLRCRRCRKCIVDSTSLSMVDNVDEGSAAACNIWHVNVDTLAGWILTSVNRAQWTVGKLNCQFCSSRLGSFNFVSRTECPCGRDATVHLNKSRVDLDQGHRVFIFQPRRSRPRIDLAHLSEYKDESPEMLRTQQQVESSSSSSGSNPVVASTDESFSFSPLYCISPRRRHSLEDASSVTPSCFCPAGPTQSAHSPAAPLSIGELCDTDAEASVNAVACLGFVSRRVRPPSHQLLLALPSLQAARETGSALETQVHPEPVPPPRGGTVDNSAPEQIEEVTTEASPGTQTPNTNRPNKKKNRLKSLRRKQRKREQWLLSQLELQKGLWPDDLQEEEEQGDADGLTCSVCLDIFFSPHSCQPCGHVFCEPCLRTLAKHRAMNTPCPLCRTLILHTNFEEELARTAQEVFPKVYRARKQSFNDAGISKWPLPKFKKRYSTFWGEQRRMLRPPGSWHFVHYGGLRLNMMDLSDIRIWCFNILLILYMNSSNWVLSLLFLGVVFYFFLF